jgi:hypothetical protein
MLEITGSTSKGRFFNTGLNRRSRKLRSRTERSSKAFPFFNRSFTAALVNPIK